MKTQVLTATKAYNDENIVDHVENQHATGVKNAKFLATSHILSGKVLLKGAFLKLFVESILSHYNSLLSYVNDRLQSTLEIQLGSAQKERHGTDELSTKKEINRLESTLPYSKKGAVVALFLLSAFGFILMLAFCLGIFLADFLYLSRSLQFIVPTYAQSLWLGFGLASAFLAICHFAEKWIWENIKAKRMRILARVSLFTLVLFTFIGLGILRQLFSLQTTTHQSPLMVFVAINTLLFIALYLSIDLGLKPLMPKIREAFNEVVLKIKAARIERKINSLKASVSESRNELSNSLEDRLRIIAFHISLEQRVARYYNESIAMYKQTIIENCETIPEFLNQSPPDLTFFTTDIKNSKS